MCVARTSKVPDLELDSLNKVAFLLFRALDNLCDRLLKLIGVQLVTANKTDDMTTLPLEETVL